MGDLTYRRMMTEEDIDIPQLRTIYQLLEIGWKKDYKRYSE